MSIRALEDDEDDPDDLIRWRGHGAKRIAVKIETKDVRSFGTCEDKDVPLDPEERAAYKSARDERRSAQQYQRAIDGAVAVSLAQSEARGYDVTAAFGVRDSDADPAIEEGRDGLTLSGYAATWDRDREGDTVDRRAFDGTLSDFLANPVVLLDHDPHRPIASVIDVKTDHVGLYIKAFVPRPEPDEEPWKITAFRDLRRGLRRGLSISGTLERASEAPRHVERVLLGEISVVSQPAQPRAVLGPAAKAAPARAYTPPWQRVDALLGEVALQNWAADALVKAAQHRQRAR